MCIVILVGERGVNSNLFVVIRSHCRIDLQQKPSSQESYFSVLRTGYI